MSDEQKGPAPMDVLKNWIDSADTNHLKDGLHFLTPEECLMAGRLLRCVAVDMMLCEAEVAESPSTPTESPKDLTVAEGDYDDIVLF